MLPCADQKCTVLAGSDGSGVPALVQNSFQATFGFNYGLFNRAVVGVTLPVVLLAGDPAYQIGPQGQNAARLNEQAFSTFAVPSMFASFRAWWRDSGMPTS